MVRDIPILRVYSTSLNMLLRYSAYCDFINFSNTFGLKIQPLKFIGTFIAVPSLNILLCD